MFLTLQKEELEEEHGHEEGLLAGAISGQGKINKAAVLKRLKEMSGEGDTAGDADSADEAEALYLWVRLSEQEADANKNLKEGQKNLEHLVAAKYKTLNHEEIQSLAVEDKWMTAIERVVKAELERISQRLTRRIAELADRYAVPLPDIIKEVETLSARVEGHLKRTILWVFYRSYCMNLRVKWNKKFFIAKFLD